MAAIVSSAVLERLEVPIVLAPLAGGPSTPELAAAVSEAGGLGFVPAGYLTAAALGERLARTRELTGRALGVNVFVPTPAAADPAVYAGYVERLRGEAGRAGAELGEPRYEDDHWEAKLDLLEAAPAAVVSFTFGCPSAETVERLRAAGSEVWVTVTSAEEARTAAEAGADALVVQGAEAGGHRGSFVDRPDVPAISLLTLLQLVRAEVGLPLVATGGVATGRALAAALAAGAAAVQVGTAFLLCPEAGTSEVHRRALAGAAPTGLTRAFTGRLARGIRNRLMDEVGEDAPIAYPEIHHATAPLRAAARKAGDGDVVNLWAGEAYQLAVEQPAAEVVRRLAQEARAALADASASL